MGVLCMLAKGSASSAQMNILAREFAIDQALRAYRIHWLYGGEFRGRRSVKTDGAITTTVSRTPEVSRTLTRRDRAQLLEGRA